MRNFVLLCALFSMCADLGLVPERAHRSTSEDLTRVEHIPAKRVLYREIVGSYQQHPQVFAEIMSYADKRYSRVGACFGVYPTDPDTVRDQSQLHWFVGVGVGPHSGAAKISAPDKPYRFEDMPAIDAAVIETDVERAGIDGLSMIRWMLENGYVQVGPTRMEYLSHEGDPTKIKTRIIVPIVKRSSGLKLPGSRDAE